VSERQSENVIFPRLFLAVLQGEAEARARVEEEAALLLQERAHLQVHRAAYKKPQPRRTLQ